GSVESAGHRERVLVGVSDACNVGVAQAVDRDSGGAISTGASDEARVDELASGVEFRHEGVILTAVCCSWTADHREGAAVRGSFPHDIGVARNVHSDAEAKVETAAADIAAVVQGGAVGADPGYESILAAVLGQVRPDPHGKRGAVGGGPSRDVGAARTVD